MTERAVDPDYLPRIARGDITEAEARTLARGRRADRREAARREAARRERQQALERLAQAPPPPGPEVSWDEMMERCGVIIDLGSDQAAMAVCKVMRGDLDLRGAYEALGLTWDKGA